VVHRRGNRYRCTICRSSASKLILASGELVADFRYGVAAFGFVRPVSATVRSQPARAASRSDSRGAGFRSGDYGGLPHWGGMLAMSLGHGLVCQLGSIAVQIQRRNNRLSTTSGWAAAFQEEGPTRRDSLARTMV